jgi:sec-independent protein translocase protein TatB
MIDLGLSKLALIGVVALVVVGPERLPKVARMAGTLMGRAQRYMAEVKSEVNRQVELDELKKMQEAATSAMRDVQSSMKDVESGFAQTTQEVSSSFTDNYDDFADNGGYVPTSFKSNLRQGKDSWGVKRAAMPQWYKKTAGVRRAATVQKAPKSFF